METIPKVKVHELMVKDPVWGTIHHSREGCKCKECMEIKRRRDSIYKKRKCFITFLVDKLTLK